MTTTPADRVLVVIDDAAAGESVLEPSSALARVLRRELSVVYVENTSSLVAATLPFTQVLTQAGAAWQPLAPADIEQGFRAHAARLRELAARAALRHAVNWSLRVMRGSLAEAPERLARESDLLFVGATPTPAPSVPRMAGRERRRLVVAAAGDGGEPGERARQVASRLAEALQGLLQIARPDATLGAGAPLVRLATGVWPDVLVLPRAALVPGVRITLRCPVLLVD